MTDYLWDRSGDDAGVAELEALLGGYAHRAPLGGLPPRRSRRGRAWLGAAVVVAVAVAALVLVLVRRPVPDPVGCGPAGPGMRFAVAGAPARCRGAAVAAGTLPVGAWLETPAGAIATVQIADVGEVTLAAGSALRLVATGADQHRLELTRGRLSARVTAPPRLFIVDTPAATAVDLGCAYDLVVEPDGRTRLVVTGGAVSLEGHGRTAYVPVGAEVTTVPGRGPGTPVMTGSAPAWVAAVERYDRSAPDQAGAALAAMLALAGDGDTITVWNALANAAPGDRPGIMVRLDELAPRPEWVLDDDVVAGQPEALEAWRVGLEGAWLVPPDDLTDPGAEPPPIAPGPGKPRRGPPPPPPIAPGPTWGP